MDKQSYRASSIVLALITAVSFTVNVQADSEAMDMPQTASVRGGGWMPHGFRHRAEITGQGWKDGLTEEQKAEIDWITLRVSQKQQLLDAQVEVKEAELNQLIVGEDVTQEQWHAKLDELLQLKRESMMNRYQRLIEVRQVLTPRQRVAFDLEILSR